MNLSPERAEMAHLSWLQDGLVKRLQAAAGGVEMILCVHIFVCLFFVYYFFASASCSFPALLVDCAARVLPHPTPSWPCPASPILPAPCMLSLLGCPVLCNPPLSTSSSLLPRKQPSLHALKTADLVNGSKDTSSGIKAGE